VTCVVIGGCGGGSSNAGKTVSPTTTTTKPKVSGPSLARAVYPTCKFAGFAPPQLKRITGPSGGLAWQFDYLLPRGVPYRRGVTSNVLIVEQSPMLPDVGAAGGHPVVVAGRRVSLRFLPRPGGLFLAVWRTKSARYEVLASGDRTTTLRRFIACLP
jgi:hypothetical protein